MAVTLAQLLQSREERVLRQQKTLSRHPVPLLCFTMNIPGPKKVNMQIRWAFSQGLKALEGALEAQTILHRQILLPETGCEAYFSVDMPADALKAAAIAIEDTHPLGRLFDMDVLDSAGKKLDRTAFGKAERGCLVCHAPGRGCASRRLHDLSQLQAAVDDLLHRGFASLCGALAAKSLAWEVMVTPKPGLVDQNNTGSHRDMTLPMFLASAQALEGYFVSCADTGRNTASLPPEDTLQAIRPLGMGAESVMLAATGGVNTHKGAIYVLGLLCAAAGRCFPSTQPGEILAECGRMVAPTLQEALANAGDSHGGRLYRTLGLTGVRGEAAKGFPSLQAGLAYYRQQLAKGLSENDAAVAALLKLMTLTQDTALYHRGGADGAEFAAAKALALLDAFSLDDLQLFDREMIERNLSPGGSADLLAGIYFLHNQETSL